MTTYKLSIDDEYSHKASEETNFNESVYANCWDMEKQCGGWMRIGNRVNENHAEVQLCFYLPDGKLACQFLRPSIKNNDAFKSGGMQYKVIEPHKKIAINYSGSVFLLDDTNILRDPKKLFKDAKSVKADIHFELNGNSPVHGGVPKDESANTMYGRDFSLGHFFQHASTVGYAIIDKEKLDLNGYGWRDHSWGPRYWTNIFYYRLLIANFPNNDGITLLKITDKGGQTRDSGVLLVNGKYEEIKNLAVKTAWNDTFEPVSIEVEATTQYREAKIKGVIKTLAPLRNRRKVGEELLETRIAEGFSTWEWNEKIGIGISEYIERVEDGRPVGYPN